MCRIVGYRSFRDNYFFLCAWNARVLERHLRISQHKTEPGRSHLRQGRANANCHPTLSVFLYQLWKKVPSIQDRHGSLRGLGFLHKGSDFGICHGSQSSQWPSKSPPMLSRDTWNGFVCPAVPNELENSDCGHLEEGSGHRTVETKLVFIFLAWKCQFFHFILFRFSKCMRWVHLDSNYMGFRRTGVEER